MRLKYKLLWSTVVVTGLTSLLVSALSDTLINRPFSIRWFIGSWIAAMVVCYLYEHVIKKHTT